MRQELAVYYCTANCEAGRAEHSQTACNAVDQELSWHTQWVIEGESPTACPHCGAPVSRRRNEYVGSATYLSDALGVAPNQIAEAKARFPHHEFAPDGRMVIRSPQHRKKILKELGMRDNG